MNVKMSHLPGTYQPSARDISMGGVGGCLADMPLVSLINLLFSDRFSARNIPATKSSLGFTVAGTVFGEHRTLPVESALTKPPIRLLTRAPCKIKIGKKQDSRTPF